MNAIVGSDGRPGAVVALVVAAVLVGACGLDRDGAVAGVEQVAPPSAPPVREPASADGGEVSKPHPERERASGASEAQRPPLLGAATAVTVHGPPPAPGPFRINLYQRGDFVSQASAIYCVPAAIQTMRNVMEPGARRSPALQDRYYRLARELSTPRLRGPGAEPEGWARTLDRLGHGPYAVDVQRTRSAAIRAAAQALRAAGRPVGLLMWRGAHAWVMTGFAATADPAFTDRFTVTHVYVSDVWYPRVSSIWGPSRPPNARVPVAALRQDYLRWHRPLMRYPDKDGRFVIVVPVPA